MTESEDEAALAALEEKQRLEAEALESKLREELLCMDGQRMIIDLVLDKNMLATLLPVLRSRCLTECANLGSSVWAEQKGVCNERLEEMATELDLALRQHRPRLAILESDYFIVRKDQLIKNAERFSRLAIRLTRTLQASAARFEQTLGQAVQRLGGFRQDAAMRVTEAATATTLSQLSTVAKIAQREKLQVESDFRATQAAAAGLTQMREKLETAAEKWIQGCKTFDQGGLYNEEEIQLYQEKLQVLASQREELIAHHNASLQKLQQQLSQDTDMKNFKSNFDFTQLELQATQGKGLKYGEPRRKFTTSIRSEFTRSDQAAQDISLLLAQISSLQPFPETGPITAEQKLIAPPSNPFSPSTASGLPRDAASPGGKASDEVSNGAGSAVKAPSRVTSPDPRSPSALSFSTAAQIALKVLPGSNAAADPAIPVMSARQALLAELQEKEPQQACVRLFVLLDKLRNQCLARALYLDVLEPKNLEFFDRQQLVLTPALTSAELEEGPINRAPTPDEAKQKNKKKRGRQKEKRQEGQQGQGRRRARGPRAGHGLLGAD